MSGFKFEIGDVVIFKSGLADARVSAAILRAVRIEFGRAPKPHVVTERLLQECPGGVQRHYKLGALAGFFLEVELLKLDDALLGEIGALFATPGEDPRP